MLTWQADDGRGLEGTRLTLHGGGFRALGRMIRTDPDGDYTASYRLVVAPDGTLERLSVTSAMAGRERHLTMNRTEDGFFLLDTGSGGTRAAFGGALDVDLAHSPMFNTLPIRRLGLHREPAEHTLPMVFVSLPDLGVELVEQHYATHTVLDAAGTATVSFRWDDFTSDLAVDSEGVVLTHPGVSSRLLSPPAPEATPAPAAS